MQASAVVVGCRRTPDAVSVVIAEGRVLTLPASDHSPHLSCTAQRRPETPCICVDPPVLIVTISALRNGGEVCQGVLLHVDDDDMVRDCISALRPLPVTQAPGAGPQTNMFLFSTSVTPSCMALDQNWTGREGSYSPMQRVGRWRQPQRNKTHQKPVQLGPAEPLDTTDLQTRASEGKRAENT